MREAEKLCDRICILLRGRIVAEGTPRLGQGVRYVIDGRIRDVDPATWLADAAPPVGGVDLDVLDESVARVNQFACPGGMTPERVLDLIRDIGANFHIGAAALTAWDPSCDPERRVPPIARSIAKAIVETLA